MHTTIPITKIPITKGLAMVDTHQQILTALLCYGQKKLMKLWGLSKSEVSRKINEDRGIKLSELCIALDAAGVKVLTSNEHEIIHKDELAALRTLANLQTGVNLNNG